jgi:hypothetical protein
MSEKCDNGNVQLRRWILLGLLVIAVEMTVVYIIRPDDGLELLCFVFAMPVYVVNGWEWFEEPEFMERMEEIFGKRKGGGEEITDVK